MPKYSIIIPVYNCIDYLPACVESVLNQTQQDFELLLVDDGSTDGSGSLCDEFARENSKIRAFHKSNGGAASARNAGIENATGEHLLFFDGDDTVETNTLELVDKAMDAADMVIFGMAFDYYNRNGELEKTGHLSCKHGGEYNTEQLLKCFKDFFEDNALSSACNKCFHADVIQENNLKFVEGMTLYEDMEFVLQYLAHAEVVKCIGTALYHYRLSKDENHLKERIADIDKLQNNLSRLVKTTIELHSTKANSVVANLYMQLLMRNLLLKKYRIPELKTGVKQYCNDENFRLALAQGAELNIHEKELLDAVESGQFRKLARRLYIKRLKSKIRGCIKRFLKAIHLYH